MRRLTILLAAVGALLLVPAANAFAETLSLNVSGTGAGEVSSVEGLHGMDITFPEVYIGEPPIECKYASGSQSGTCKNELEDLEEGIAADGLVAIPAPGSDFAGWTHTGGFQFGGELGPPGKGGCRETALEGEYKYRYPTCLAYTETGSGSNVALTAKFVERPGFFLTVAKTGEGTVVSSPAGIICGSECSNKFEGTVTLTASPATGYAFSAWAGCTEHVGLTCKVTMSKALTVKATFVATPSLTIEKAGSGQGKVGATGISCDENCSKAKSAIKTGTSVTVKTTPAKGSEAAVIEGGTGSASACSGSTCTFTISENSSLKVKFSPIPTKTLTVNLTGPAAYKGKVSGKGTVKGLTASAINCGAGCTTQTESFFSTDEVTLTAVAGTGYTFAGWSGSEAGTCTGTTSPCTISTSANKTLSAKFQ